MFDDDLPKPKTDQVFPRMLDNLSVSDLQDYVDDLEAEIVRVKGEIQSKAASRDAADSFFKS